MTYCTASDVRLVISTELMDAEIESLISMSDGYIDKRIGAQSTADMTIKRLSVLLTAEMIKTRQPQSYAVGEYREEAGNILEVWRNEIERIFKLYEDEIDRARHSLRGV